MFDQPGQLLRAALGFAGCSMPGEDGYWLLGEIRRHADGGVSGLPVVAATAYARDHSRARVLAAGFLDHLPKPIDPDVLCRAIAAAVGR